MTMYKRITKRTKIVSLRDDSENLVNELTYVSILFDLTVVNNDERSILPFGVTDGKKTIPMDYTSVMSFINDIVDVGFQNMKDEYSILSSLVSVQPMDKATGQIFNLKSKYNG